MLIYIRSTTLKVQLIFIYIKLKCCYFHLKRDFKFHVIQHLLENNTVDNELQLARVFKTCLIQLTLKFVHCCAVSRGIV